MNKETHSFEVWFDTLNVHLLDKVGVDFKDEESVREDYDTGRDVFDVIDEIAAEYGDGDDD